MVSLKTARKIRSCLLCVFGNPTLLFVLFDVDAALVVKHSQRHLEVVNINSGGDDYFLVDQIKSYDRFVHNDLEVPPQKEVDGRRGGYATTGISRQIQA